MTLLSIFQAALSFMNWAAKYLSDKQLLDAGQAQAVAEGLTNAQTQITLAIAAANAVHDDPDGVPDPFNTDDKH